MKLIDYYDKNKLDPDLLHFAKVVRARLRQDKDMVICLSGGEGSGKSTMAIVLGALIDGRFDLEKNVSYIPNEKEVKEEFYRLKRYQYYLIDEAIRALYKMNFMSNLQQMLIRIWATERFQNKCTTLIIPRFRDLTENFRNHRVMVWIHVISRGHAIAYLKDDDAHIQDPWHIEETSKYKQRRYKNKNPSLLSIEDRVRIEKNTRNFMAYFQFPDLPREIKEKYDELKLESRRKYDEEEASKEDTKISMQAKELRKLRDRMIYLLIKKTAKFNYENMPEITGLTKTTLMKIVKGQKKIIEEEEHKKSIERTQSGIHRQLDTALNLINRK